MTDQGAAREAALQGVHEAEFHRDRVIPRKADDIEKQSVIIKLADRLVSPWKEAVTGTETLADIVMPRRESSQENDKKLESFVEIDAALKQARAEWTKSEDAKHLRNRLHWVVMHKKLVGVRKIVCFDLDGPWTWHLGVPPTDAEKLEGYGNRSLIRHVAALWMAQNICECPGGAVEIKVYSQELSFRPEDRAVLAAHGITALDGQQGQHEGFREIDANTLVFMMGGGVENNIRVICATNRPAGIICSIHRPSRSNVNYDGLQAAFHYLDTEYDAYADWMPFYHPAFPEHLNVRGPQTMKEAAVKNKQRPLQGATVWLRKLELHP
ncbi:hypothetical protein RRF57_001384 [Xylaria bambusicola]|uniref:Uncharacterized protein n=1 Tax=Xylaria bambusicola TaxID=326684 RepID=A0AAN7UCB1_9PEZI